MVELFGYSLLGDGAVIFIGLLGLSIFSIFILFSLLVIASLVFYKRKGRILFPQVVLTLSAITESIVKAILPILGLSTDWLLHILIDLRNRVGKQGFRQSGFSERILFLPQCIRHADCPALSDFDGLHCLGCGACNVAEITGEAEKLGYMVFVAPGSSLVKRMTLKHKPRAVLGLGCLFEIKEFQQLMSKLDVEVQGILLESGGCVETTFNKQKVIECLKQHA